PRAARGAPGGGRGVAGGGRPPRERGRVRGGRPPLVKRLPTAPLAAVMVLALVVGTARLAFTGTVRFASGAGGAAASAVTGDDLTGSGGGASTAGAKAVTGPARASGAVLVGEGFGS